MKKLWLVLGAVCALIALGVYLWLRQAPPPPPPPAPAVAPPTVAAPPAAAPATPPISFPVEAPPGVSELPPLDQADNFVKERLAELLGAGSVAKFIQIDGFVRRVVATVDNLGRPLAPPSKWPVQSTPGRFTVETAKDGSVIGATNAARYTAFVALLESVDAKRAVALYQRLYPLFQRAYEELGYPRMYFNDRLIAVIDLLLATPEPAAAPKVELPQFPGPLKPMRPWVLYRYADPALERLASGQKILLRVGTDNAQRLKSKLAEIRKLLAAGKVSR